MFICEELCKCTFKKGKVKNLEEKNYFFVCILKVTDENTRIWSWIRIR
jgi:hypothetical protein